MAPTPPSRGIILWDRVYRHWHHLDAPGSKIAPVLTIGLERAWGRHRLADGTVLRFGDRYGELHLDNAAVITLHRRGLPPIQVGLELRRGLRASLARLARLTEPGERFADLRAFSAITIFHQGLSRLGFAAERDGLIAPHITGAYQCALISALAIRRGRHRAPRAQRLWISAARLRALYGEIPRAAGAEGDGVQHARGGL